MQLKGVTFEAIWDAPGVRGWIGEGYWFHRLPIYQKAVAALNDGSTFVSKTTTLDENDGKMPLRGKEELYAPREWKPRCISVNFFNARTFNAIGLSGPGIRALIEIGILKRPGSSMLSFAAVKPTSAERLEETRGFVHILMNSPVPIGRIGVQVNITCPNTGHDVNKLVLEVIPQLDALVPLSEAGIPIIVKINLFTPIELAEKIAEHEATAALCVTNALAFKDAQQLLNLRYRSSPLAEFGGGGFSGPEMLPHLRDYVRCLFSAGVTCPLNVGGGIRHEKHVTYLVEEAGLRRGVDSIFIASAMLSRPWNVPGIVRRVHMLLA